ncbi:MAG TPA: type 4a pilus biogenesis protein PilO [Nitrospira sp.]|jgi:type IV pilus assembly protein PilO|nr:type 4a pilus biogenesis protein PilO [Nitrospira sp.]MCC7470361.1 type 4a pilus biogenesis protein PilO [Candidatus Nomurabacteria bacterium]MBS0160075.1 type 4a pilus biogenesis protein PilO [Nitrospira sp.]MBS0163280.1 type 4a pilus biogenesis protein PilO [Nitrospira sp.]MBS0175544.1 type 4a pilus biogenesis protein PilO [Nitrospira sp.]
MSLNAISLDSLRSIPTGQKVALLGLLVAGILVGFYFYVVDPKTVELEAVQGQVAQLDTEIQNLTLKVKHLDELVAANKQLEIELAAKKERLPPEEEAVMLLKQVSDLGLRLGLDVKLWKPGTQAEDPSKLFIRMPINVEVAGGYHTAAIFFDRISKLSRIVTVQDVRIGAARVDQGRVVTQTVFDLVAYAAPQEKKATAPAPAAKPK